MAHEGTMGVVGGSKHIREEMYSLTFGSPGGSRQSPHLEGGESGPSLPLRDAAMRDIHLILGSFLPFWWSESPHLAYELPFPGAVHKLCNPEISRKASTLDKYFSLITLHPMPWVLWLS